LRGKITCEYVHEFAKELTWEDRYAALGNQTWILGYQYEMLRRCSDQVEVIIMDTSLLNSTLYCHNYNLPFAKQIEDLAIAMYRSMDNLTFFVNRVKAYNPIGRSQTEEEAREIDAEINGLMKTSDIGSWYTVPGNEVGEKEVLEIIEQQVAARKY
jgi:nicotinamide riboside kinase